MAERKTKFDNPQMGKGVHRSGTTPGGREYHASRGVNEKGKKFSNVLVKGKNGYAYTKSKGEPPRTVASNPDATFKKQYRGRKNPKYIAKGSTKKAK